MLKKKPFRLVLAVCSAAAALVAFAIPAGAQNKAESIAVSGTVVDSSGEPLIGAGVVISGTTNGTVTDVDGKFSLKVPSGSTLEVSSLGYASKEVKVLNSNTLKIVLDEDSQMLNETIVIGYGTRLRSAVTGSVDQVNSGMIENRPVANAIQALQGASPNLIIQQRSMNPNDNTMNINIRGVSTMGNNDPLIVVDGLISSASTLTNLNPNDIESVSVLKDAGSAAIYGSRSANGVILVTTRSGRTGEKPQISFSAQAGYEMPEVLFRPVAGWENAMLRNEANFNSGLEPQFTPEAITDLYNHRGEEYWYIDKILQDGLQQNYNFRISGGTANTTYAVSAGYYNQESNFVGGYGLERYNVRSNISTTYKNFKVTSMLAYNRREEQAIVNGNTLINSTRIPPYYNYKFEQDGKWLINDVIGDDNTLAVLMDGGKQLKDQDNIVGSLGLDYTIIEGLTAKGLVGLDLTQHHRFIRRQRVPLYSAKDLTRPVLYYNDDTRTEDYNVKYHTLTTQFLLDFNRTFGKVHNVSALLGVSNESYTSKASEIKWQFTDEDLGLPTTDKALQDPSNYNTPAATDQTSITSFFGRVGYNYDYKYYVDFSFRYDGSSKFAKAHRWGFFPSVSLAWNATSEDFMEGYRDNVGTLKLRTSYGVLGNQNVANYSYQTVFQMYPNTYGFNNSPVPGTGYTYGNPELTWEKSANLNVGLDASFLNGKFYASFDYFNKRTWDILLSPIVSSTFGSSASNQNMGEMVNRGWEFLINYKAKTGNFKHDISFNLADSRNTVINFGGKEHIKATDQVYQLIREGEALNSYYGYKSAGLFRNWDEIENGAVPTGLSPEPGDVKYVDQNGDEVIDEKDRVVLGNAFPRFTFGLTYNLSWKGFDLNVLFQGVGKRDRMVRGELMEPFHENYSYCIYTHQLDYWTLSNPDASRPRLTAPGATARSNNYGFYGTDLYLLDGAYLRLKNLAIGYTIPKKITFKAGIEKLRIYANAENLFTLTKYPFVDPESSEFGNNMGGTGGTGANSARNYPTLRYVGFGVELDF